MFAWFKILTMMKKTSNTVNFVRIALMVLPFCRAMILKSWIAFRNLMILFRPTSESNKKKFGKVLSLGQIPNG